MDYYVDTCIWINMFQKEGDASKGVPYWKIAEDFTEFVEKNCGKIIISTFVLKELKFRLEENFEQTKDFLKSSEIVTIIKANQDDYDFARKIESESDFSISFADCMHIAISKRMGAILVTRDKAMLGVGRKYVTSEKPEDLIR